MSPMSREAFALLPLLLALEGCGSPPAPAEASPSIQLTAIRASDVRIDGELDEPAWASAEISPRFVDAATGEPTTPYTEARALFDDEALTLALYGADEDVRSTDRMGAILHAPGGGTFVVEIDPGGEIHWHAPSAASGPPPEGVRAAVDADATLDQDDLDDEEWIAEIRIPWRALGMDGPGDVRANFFRRDQPRGSLARSLAWAPWHERPTASLDTLGVIHCAPRS